MSPDSGKRGSRDGGGRCEGRGPRPFAGGISRSPILLKIIGLADSVSPGGRLVPGAEEARPARYKGLQEMKIAAAGIPMSNLLSALSFALDLTEGQPMGHALRSCFIGMKIGERLGLSAQDGALHWKPGRLQRLSPVAGAPVRPVPRRGDERAEKAVGHAVRSRGGHRRAHGIPSRRSQPPSRTWTSTGMGRDTRGGCGGRRSPCFPGSCVSPRRWRSSSPEAA